MFGGTDYSIPFIIIVSATGLFSAQYLLCARANKMLIKCLPFLYVGLISALAVKVALTPGGGFVDLSMLAALLLFIYAAVCLAAVIAARIVYRFRRNCQNGNNLHK